MLDVRTRADELGGGAATEGRPYMMGTYPFAALVGMEAAKRALLLLAIDPGLKGALISGPPGCAKSLLARSFRSLFAGLDGLAEPPSVELPLNVTEDGLLGGLDLEASIASNQRVLWPGILQRADGGAIYVDGINLLDESISDRLSAALEDRIVRLEREGVSESFDCRFVLIGTSDSTEGDVNPSLIDRVGLTVEVGADESSATTIEIIERAIRFEHDPAGFVEAFAIETASIKAQIEEARRLLHRIRVDADDIGQLAQAACTLGVEGNRADIFAVRAARANAALSGRSSLDDEDLVVAIKLVLLPRANTLPEATRADRARPQVATDSPESVSEQPPRAERKAASVPDELIIEAIGSTAPVEALVLKPKWRIDRSRSASGKRARSVRASRGRYSGSTSRKQSGSRVAIDATLRSAAPHQALRRARRRSGLPPTGNTPAVSGAIARRVQIAPDDLRFKRFKRRSGALFIFAVDSSGSMAVNRMAQAKGAITALLSQAYLSRDKVALISFRRSQAELLLAPTRSVELAKRIVDALPTGGATPLAAALIKGLELTRLARLQGVSRSVLLLMTDGRANVRWRANETHNTETGTVGEELSEIGRALASEGVEQVVIDTRPGFAYGGDAQALADAIGARYLHLPRANTAAIQAAIREAVD